MFSAWLHARQNSKSFLKSPGPELPEYMVLVSGPLIFARLDFREQCHFISRVFWHGLFLIFWPTVCWSPLVVQPGLEGSEELNSVLLPLLNFGLNFRAPCDFTEKLWPMSSNGGSDTSRAEVWSSEELNFGLNCCESDCPPGLVWQDWNWCGPSFRRLKVRHFFSTYVHVF